MIDVHAHYLPDFLVEALEAAGRKPALAAFPRWSPQECLAMMDRFGIAATLLSVSTPGVHFGQTSAAAVLARRCNEYCADLAVSSGGRLGGFAALPLPAIDAALCALQALYDAADDDSATGGPDMTRRIFPVVTTVTGDGFRRWPEAQVAEAVQQIVAGRMDSPDGPTAALRA